MRGDHYGQTTEDDIDLDDKLSGWARGSDTIHMKEFDVKCQQLQAVKEMIDGSFPFY